MRTLVFKEIRLLLPAYAAAVLLILAWQLVVPADATTGRVGLMVFPLGCGAVMLALSSFGREVSLNTFSLILAQPMERARMWRAKIGVLAAALATVLIAWAAACLMKSPWEFPETLLAGGLTVATLVGGGLWTTLLLRQVTVALWLTLLVPLALLLAVTACGGGDASFVAVLAVYSVTGFAWAWRHFLRIQETAWTGGVVDLGAWRARAATRIETRSPRPFAALFWKEVHLHQVGLLGISWLFATHLGVIILRKVGMGTFGDSTRSALEAFGGLWVLVPFLVSATSVAEEHKLGTADSLLSLPVSARLQFAMKLLFALVLGGLLSPALLCIAEFLADAFGVPANIGGIKLSAGNTTLFWVFLGFLGLSLVGFYASTIARNLVQAVGVGIGASFLLSQLGQAALRREDFLGYVLWRGEVVHFVGWPIVVGTLIWLAWQNFRWLSGGAVMLRRNLLGVLGALALIVLFSVALFQRAWELLMPLEPVHGAPRMALASPPQTRTHGGSAIAVVLPDGRLWVDEFVYDPGKQLLALDGQRGLSIGAHWRSLEKRRPVPGTNWVDAVANFRETVAIRADGTLWVSEQPSRQYWSGRGQDLHAEASSPLVRFGGETTWRKVVSDFLDDSPGVVLLKQDGTLWRWTWLPSAPGAKPPPGLRNSEPRRLGADANWERLAADRAGVYAWKTDGAAWVLQRPSKKVQDEGSQSRPAPVLERCPAFDNTKWLSLTECWPREVAVREDGTLWVWTTSSPPAGDVGDSTAFRRPVQIGKDTDWKAVGGGFQALTALKADGSIWQFSLGPWRAELATLMSEPPRRLGKNRDWVALGGVMGGTVALAADGSLWYWWPRDKFSRTDPGYGLLSPSRRPDKLGNVFEE